MTNSAIVAGRRDTLRITNNIYKLGYGILTPEEYRQPLEEVPLAKRILDALYSMQLEPIPLLLTEVAWRRGIYRDHLLACLERASCNDNKPIVYIQDIQRMRESRHGYLLAILETMTIVKSVDDLLCEASRE